MSPLLLYFGGPFTSGISDCPAQTIPFTKTLFSAVHESGPSSAFPKTKTGLCNQGVIVRSRGISIYSGILRMLDTSLYWEPVPKSVGLSKNISVCPESVKAGAKQAHVLGGVKGTTENGNVVRKDRVAWKSPTPSCFSGNMAFSITFNITAEPEATVTRIMGEARKAGVELNGDDKQGTFAGFNAKGSYSREANQIRIVVTEKPFFFSESLIRKLAVEKAPTWGLAVA